MAGARDEHVACRREGPVGAKELGARERPFRAAAARDEDAAVGQQGRRGAGSPARHGPGRRPGAARHARDFTSDENAEAGSGDDADDEETRNSPHWQDPFKSEK